MLRALWPKSKHCNAQPSVRRYNAAAAKRHGPALEILEDRLLRSGGISLQAAPLAIVVDGTESDDWVTVNVIPNGLSASDDQIVVTLKHNGDVEQQTYALYQRVDRGKLRPITQIIFKGHEGNDQFFNSTNLPALADGGEGNDALFGGSNKDTLLGGDGEDYIEGRNGDDTIDGGLIGKGMLLGNDGNDTITGGIDDDLIFGGNGRDNVDGNMGNDTIYGGADNDTLNGGTGFDTIDGEAGNDEIYGYHGADSISGGDGYDTIDGGTGDDTIDGGLNNDSISGGDGNDKIDGGLNNDIVNGGEGNDTIHGGDGKDTLNGDAGKDVMDGGIGNDTLNGGDDADDMAGGVGNDSLDGGFGDDFLYGQEDKDTLKGGWGDDTLLGAGGNDWMDGSFGNDSLSGFDGNDTLWGGSEYDEIYGGDGNDQLHGGSERDTLDGGAGTDALYGDSGNDSLSGGAGLDWLDGGIGDDMLFGGGSVEFDVLTGNDGADRLLVQPGDLTLDLSQEDARINFVNGAAGSHSGPESFDYGAGTWTDEEILAVDKALAVMQGRTGNMKLLRTTDGDELIFERLGATVPATPVSGWNTGDETISLLNNAFSSSVWLRSVVYHEVGHNWDSGDGPLWDTFLNLSGWEQTPLNIPPDYKTQSDDGEWWYLKFANFTRPYGRTNPREDFATAWEAYFGQYTGDDNAADADNAPGKVQVIDQILSILAV